jgi:hypothetical protein
MTRGEQDLAGIHEHFFNHFPAIFPTGLTVENLSTEVGNPPVVAKLLESK